MFRQRDPIYIKILNQIRQGKISINSCNKLKEYVNREKDPKNKIKPTILMPTRKQVDRINIFEMNRLNTEIITIKIETDDKTSGLKRGENEVISDQQKEHEINHLKTNLLCEQSLDLKKGAQVMCIANIDVEGLDAICNGSQGIIIGFIDGMPQVEFHNGVKRIMSRHSWASENIPGISVNQVPLILAWAITIHKSQGATLDIAEIDIGSGIFECGQTYVALSRLKSLDGLYLKSFDPFKILVNRHVKEYYSKM
jgi:ATP-dependent DNA helicase PIF1